MNKKNSAQPLIVALETSGRRGSVALANGPKLLGQTDFTAPMRHGAELLAAIDDLLHRFGTRASAVKHVYLSIGPGSFTGLRIAVTFAKTLHLANSAKLIAVRTSDVIAANTRAAERRGSDCRHIATILDAKRGQFFVAAYERRKAPAADARNAGPLGQYEKTLPDCLMTAEQFVERFRDSQPAVGLLGEGLVYYANSFRAAGIEIIDEKYWWPQAANVHLLGWHQAQTGLFAAPDTLEPLYLRAAQLGASRIRRTV
jgi:tRNA threonylcarbamoyl adenosine modification protein YeaZ